MKFELNGHFVVGLEHAHEHRWWLDAEGGNSPQFGELNEGKKCLHFFTLHLLHFSPLSPIIFEVHAGVAQLLERVLAKDEVQG